MKEILFPVLALASMGAIFGLLLAISSKIFRVDTDERLPLVIEALPGANCGGCGFAGCANFADAVVSGNAPVNGCPVGGAKTAEKVAAIMGVDAGDTTPLVAHVNCRGGVNAKQKYRYEGIQDCTAASKISGGPMECQYGCLGLGTCVKACPYGAISIVNGVAEVYSDKCRACRKCVAACPRHIISVVSESQDVFVSCSSRNTGGELRQVCNIGCIACTLCAKKCPEGAISVTGNLAQIDYDKCTNCGECALVCPRKLIINASEQTSINAI